MTFNKLPIGVFHPGTQHSWQTARSLQDIAQLGWYATSIFWASDRLPYRLVPFLPPPIRERITAELRRFHHPGLNLAHVKTFAGPEWAMRVAGRLGFRDLSRRLQASSNTAFAKPVQNLLQQQPVRAVWGYDLASLEVFRAARQVGIKTILDRTIGHPATYNRILDEIYDGYPEFFSSTDYKIKSAIIERADEEHSLADLIVVGSNYCASTLVEPRKIALPPVRIVPYCFDDVFFDDAKPRLPRKPPLRFLFTGLAGPRKGIHLILKVFQKIPPSAATLTIVGDLQVPKDTFAKYADRVTVRTTVPRPDVAEIMRQADYLLFPSYFEGAGIVLYEAMAAGLGIIQSKHADIVLPADSELLMRELTEDELYRCVMTAIEKPELLAIQSASGLREARTQYTFQCYRDRVEEIANLV